jgi:hypothetical protein
MSPNNGVNADCQLRCTSLAAGQRHDEPSQTMQSDLLVFQAHNNSSVLITVTLRSLRLLLFKIRVHFFINRELAGHSRQQPGWLGRSAQRYVKFHRGC